MKVDHEYKVKGIWYVMKGTFDPDGGFKGTIHGPDWVDADGKERDDVTDERLINGLVCNLEDDLLGAMEADEEERRREEIACAAEAYWDARREEGL